MRDALGGHLQTAAATGPAFAAGATVGMPIGVKVPGSHMVEGGRGQSVRGPWLGASLGGQILPASLMVPHPSTSSSVGESPDVPRSSRSFVSVVCGHPLTQVASYDSSLGY